MVKYLALALITATASASTLQAPTAFQIYPYLATVCLNDGPASTYGVTDLVNLTGTASLQGYLCKLKVHAGRGSGIRIVSACAEVVWDAAGNVTSVTPTVAEFQTWSIVCP